MTTATLPIEEVDAEWRGVCKVPGCTVDVKITYGGETWCIEHIVDDWLPELVPGAPHGVCSACGQMAVHVHAGDPEVWLHERCRRKWVLLALGAKPAGQPSGAYARRRASGGG